MAKRKPKKKQFGVKGMHLPKALSYIMAGVGVLVLVIFLGYLFVKGAEAGAKKEKANENTQEKTAWARDVQEWKTSGTLLSVTKDSNSDGIARVDKSRWEKLPFDSREALAVAVARAEDIKTLQIRDENDLNLGICRNGARLLENKN